MGFLWVLAAVGSLTASGRAIGQPAGGAPASWQPYREEAAQEAAWDGEVDLATAITDGDEISPVEAPVMFPQPVFGTPVVVAPGCEAPVYVDGSPAAPLSNPEFWHWRVLPEGVVWQSYWAGVHEPRISGVAFHDANSASNLFDVTLGGRASLLRYGTEGVGRPQGAELQIEGAAFPRLNLDENWDLEATDFRFGLPLVYGRDRWQAKFSYYHLSSHLGDELAIRDGTLADRINFSRDALVLGLSYYPLPAWRWYAEAGWAFHYDESEPWEFQFGVDVAEPGPTGRWGTPFFAVNGHVREELDYGGNVVAQAGWLWRGNSSQTLRTGVHYFNGKSSQLEVFDQFEEQIGGGVWYEF